MATRQTLVIDVISPMKPSPDEDHRQAMSHYVCKGADVYIYVDGKQKEASAQPRICLVAT